MRSTSWKWLAVFFVGLNLAVSSFPCHEFILRHTPAAYDAVERSWLEKLPLVNNYTSIRMLVLGDSRCLHGVDPAALETNLGWPRNSIMNGCSSGATSWTMLQTWRHDLPHLAPGAVVLLFVSPETSTDAASLGPMFEAQAGWRERWQFQCPQCLGLLGEDLCPVCKLRDDLHEWLIEGVADDLRSIGQKSEPVPVYRVLKNGWEPRPDPPVALDVQTLRMQAQTEIPAWYAHPIHVSILSRLIENILASGQHPLLRMAPLPPPTQAVIAQCCQVADASFRREIRGLADHFDIGWLPAATVEMAGNQLGYYYDYRHLDRSGAAWWTDRISMDLRHDASPGMMSGPPRSGHIVPAATAPTSPPAGIMHRTDNPD